MSPDQNDNLKVSLYDALHVVFKLSYSLRYYSSRVLAVGNQSQIRSLVYSGDLLPIFYLTWVTWLRGGRSYGIEGSSYTWVQRRLNRHRFTAMLDEKS